MQNHQFQSRKDMAFISVHGEDENVYGWDTFGPFFPIHDEESQDNFIGEWFLIVHIEALQFLYEKIWWNLTYNSTSKLDGEVYEKIGQFIIFMK